MSSITLPVLLSFGRLRRIAYQESISCVWLISCSEILIRTKLQQHLGQHYVPCSQTLSTKVKQFAMKKSSQAVMAAYLLYRSKACPDRLVAWLPTCGKVREKALLFAILFSVRPFRERTCHCQSSSCSWKTLCFLWVQNATLSCIPAGEAIFTRLQKYLVLWLQSVNYLQLCSGLVWNADWFEMLTFRFWPYLQSTVQTDADGAFLESPSMWTTGICGHGSICSGCEATGLYILCRSALVRFDIGLLIESFCAEAVGCQGLQAFGWTMLNQWQRIAWACLKHWLPFSGKQVELVIAGASFPGRWWPSDLCSSQSERSREQRRGGGCLQSSFNCVKFHACSWRYYCSLAYFRQLQVTIRPNTDMSGFTLCKALEMAAQFLDGRLQPLILQQPRHDWKCHGPKPFSSIQKLELRTLHGCMADTCLSSFYFSGDCVWWLQSMQWNLRRQ